MSSSSTPRRGLPQRVRMRHDSHFVEELAARSEVPVGKLVPISQVEPDPDQPRTAMGDLTDLAASIGEKGILEPILVRPRDARPGTLVIISGERRYRAAVEVGLLEIPVIEMDVSTEEALEIALIENLQRKDLTPFEEAEGYQRLGQGFSYTHQQISVAVGKSRTVITESLRLLALPVRVREVADALGVKTKSVLLEILKEDDESSMIKLLEKVHNQGLSRDDLRQTQRKTKSSKASKVRKPFVYKFRAADKTFSFNLRFRRKNEVSKPELIETLERVLEELRQG